MLRCNRGSEPIRHLLRTKSHDVREQSPETYPRWLERHLRGWGVDPLFQQRLRIREIRRGRPELQTLEREREAARTDFEASPEFQEHERLRRELTGAENAVAGLTHAHGRATDDAERSRLLEKLTGYELAVAETAAALESLREHSAAWGRLRVVAARLADVRKETGFDREILRLTELQRRHGRSGGRSGAAFESLAGDAIAQHVMPEFEAERGAGSILILNRVRLGSARAEFDQLVVRTDADPRQPVTVLAAAEAKRNPNDLSRGLANRIQDLAWFSGRADRYNAEDYRTTAFPSGHFDQPAVHLEKGEKYIFNRASFARFESGLPDDQETGLPEGMYLVTRPVTLWGLASGAIARLAHRVSSDLAFDLLDPGYTSELLDWTRGLAGAIETPDLIRQFARDETVARRVLLLSSE